MSYKNNSYGNPNPKSFLEKSEAWARGEKPGLFKNLRTLNNLPLELTLDFLDLDLEIEFEKKYRESKSKNTKLF